jgi:hypothetical protein
MSIRDIARQAAESPKVASAVSAVTTSTGIGTWFDWIPDDIGKLATLAGVILSVVLIYNHVRRGRVEFELAQTELRIMREREAERIERALQRRAAGQSLRRSDDTI